jgi:hypothetical protein
MKAECITSGHIENSLSEEECARELPRSMGLLK